MAKVLLTAGIVAAIHDLFKKSAKGFTWFHHECQNEDYTKFTAMKMARKHLLALLTH